MEGWYMLHGWIASVWRRSLSGISRAGRDYEVSAECGVVVPGMKIDIAPLPHPHPHSIGPPGADPHRRYDRLGGL